MRTFSGLPVCSLENRVSLHVVVVHCRAPQVGTRFLFGVVKFYFKMFLCCCFAWVLMTAFVGRVDSQNFGDNIDSVGFGGDVVSKNEDHRFSDMGQVTKDIFDVKGGIVNLTLNVQDTDGIKEVWILDFQPYRYNVDALPINDLTGMLVADNTGPCSSVYSDESFDNYLSDDYFQDRTDAELVTKSLFTGFERGASIDADGRRNNKIHFNGDMETWFDCTESDDSTDVWRLTSDASDVDEIEYRTKLYAINVRPKDEMNFAGGISFVQSHIELIWRLSRTAISKELISSTALLQPILEFARVSAVFDDNGDPIATQALLHIRFRTAVDSQEQMVTYIANSIIYTPDSNSLNHALNYVLSASISDVFNGPQCDFQLDEGTSSQLQCNQVWEFRFVLDIDITGHEDNRAPVDASGTFEFSYQEHTCVSNTNQFDINLCTALPGDPAKIAAVITIQTTVFIQDEEDDQVAILLVALKGADNQELSVPGSRGIAHKEQVSLEVKFSPAILRTDYKLDLLLFMVCRGEQYKTDEYPHGCLQAPTEDRYVAHMTDAFTYTPRFRNVSGLFEEDPYGVSHVENDYRQNLAFEGYMVDDEFGRPLPVPVHRSTFINVALSAESEKYVITAVYRLSDIAARKRRALTMYDIAISKMAVGDDQAVSAFHGNSIFSRHKRDIEDSAVDAHSQRFGFNSIGCPEDALHRNMDCHCPAGSEYSTQSFQCEIDTSAANDVVDILEEKTKKVYSGTCAHLYKTSTLVTAIVLLNVLKI